MPSERDLPAALREKSNISDRGIRKRRERIQKILPMPANVATAIVAQRAGVPINRYLDDATLASVSTWEAQLAQKEAGQATATSPLPPSRGGRAHTKVVREAKLGDVSVPANRLSQRHLDDAERMARVYPVLYVFENSIREFVDGHLIKAYGSDWWDEDKLVAIDLRRTVERNRKAEALNRAHTSQKARPVYYLTLGELVNIVQSEKGAKVFKKPMFPRATWFPELVQSAEVTRNKVAHMNPIQKKDVRRLEDRLSDWLEQTDGYDP
jgi:Swt1-like HEPN